MSSFTTPLIVKHLDGRRWEVMEAFEYRVGGEESTEVIRVPKHFITDFASIPWPFWSIIGHPTGKHGKAAVIHDYTYFMMLYSRLECDRKFLEAMGVSRVAWWRKRFMYRAVRVFAWIGWNKHRKRNGDT